VDRKKRERTMGQQEMVAGDSEVGTAPDVGRPGAPVSPGDPIAGAVVPSKGEE
jgi:hypothetical protein